MDNNEVIAAFSEELKGLAGKRLPQDCYLPDGVPNAPIHTPGLYQVENIRPDLYPDVGVNHLLLREDGSGLLYTGDLLFGGEYKRPSYTAHHTGEGLEMLIGYERCGTCKVVKLA